MALAKEKLEGLDFALEEAHLAGVEVDPAARVAAVTVSVLWLPAEGPPPADDRIQIVLKPIGRVAASLRHGRWDDPKALVEPFELRDLPKVFDRIGGRPIYGYEFFDVPERKGNVFSRKHGFALWSDRLSLDWVAGESDGLSHTLALFQEGWEGKKERHFDLQLWFDDLELFRPDYSPMEVDELVEGAKRWWRGLREGDPRTQDRGIVPLE